MAAAACLLQIARISCTTVVCPAELFMVNEEGGLENAEEYSQLPAREMGATANWSHRYEQPQQNVIHMASVAAASSCCFACLLHRF
jgi:hypothetical protein